VKILLLAHKQSVTTDYIVVVDRSISVSDLSATVLVLTRAYTQTAVSNGSPGIGSGKSVTFDGGSDRS